MTSPDLTDGLAALIRGDTIAWSLLEVTPERFIEACNAQDLAGLIHSRVERDNKRTWPLSVREPLAERSRADAARELLRRREVENALSALAAEGVYPILFKGTPLAYEVYPAPHLRTRTDTDLLILRTHVDAARRALGLLGYAPSLLCDGELLFCQFELEKTDEFGVQHAFDVHWKISTQSVFADLLTYDELAAQARPVPALGPHARCPGFVHALLLACLHPAMHHRNAARLIWSYDVHLLASRLSATELDQVVNLAASKRVLAICRHALSTSCALFGTSLPESLLRRMDDVEADEPSATYLQSDRRWHNELASNLGGLPDWGRRVTLLREVLFPAPGYIQRAYGVAPGRLTTLLLPLFYLHRVLRGGVNVLVGRK
jgi:hypothetical protein